jgi:hypothetical protein
MIKALKRLGIAVILATQKAEIRRITVQSQPGQIVHEILFKNIQNTHTRSSDQVVQVAEQVA